MRRLKLFTHKWMQSWKTKPDFILTKKFAPNRRVSGKFSFLNAFISGALGVRTLLSIFVGIAGITSIVVYDTVINHDSPIFVSADNSDLEADNKELLADLSYLLSSKPETVIEPVITETAVEPVPENTDTGEIVSDPGDDVLDVSPETGDKNIIILFVMLQTISFISAAVIFKLNKTKYG